MGIIVMGHAAHFLTRLQRVSVDQCDFALQLYREPAFVGLLLAGLEDELESKRAAISLSPDDEGPFVIVEKNGDFVTCLKKGMVPYDVHLLSYDFLTARRGMLERVRQGNASFKALAEANVATSLVARLKVAGETLTREEMKLLRVIQPVMLYDFITLFFSITRDLRDRRDTIVGLMHQGRKKRTKARRELSRTYWEQVWLGANLHVICSLNGPGDLITANEDMPDILYQYHNHLVNEGVVAVAVRALWGAGMRGHCMVKTYDRLLDELTTFSEQLTAVTSLTVVALRHPDQRPEVDRLFSRLDRFAEADNLLGTFLSLGRLVLEDPVTMSKVQNEAGTHIYEQIRGRLGKDHPDYYRSIRAVPDPLLMSLGAMSMDDFRTDGIALMQLFCCLPWLARVDAEELFLPARVQEHFPSNPTECGEELFGRHVMIDGRFTPHVSSAEPGRNDPCPCGSGSKYKRCCSRKAGH
ncbi:MAG: YecA family protein [Bradymonadaceae bacterium]